MNTKLLKAGLGALLIILVTGCTSQVKPFQTQAKIEPPLDEVQLLKQKRSQLQFQFSRLTDEWWQRSGELASTQSELPLLSNNPDTIVEINRVLKNKNEALTKKLIALNQKVEARKRGDVEGIKLNLALKYAGYKAANAEKSKAVQPSQINLVQGETQLWQLYTKQGLVLPRVAVTLSEANQLFIENQLIAQLELDKPSSNFITSVTLYGQQIYAAGQLDMMLAPTIAK